MMISLRKVDRRKGLLYRSFHDDGAGAIFFRDAAYESFKDLSPAAGSHLALLSEENADVELSALIAVSAAEGFEMVYCHLYPASYPLSSEVIRGLWGHTTQPEHSPRLGGSSLVAYFFSIALSSEEK